MNTYTIDHIHKQFSCPSGAGISKVIGKIPLSRLFIAFTASLILIGCGSSGSDAPTAIQGETNTPVEQTDASQEQAGTPDEQGETNTPVEQTDTSQEQAGTPDEQGETNTPVEQTDTSQEQTGTPDEQGETNTPLEQTDASQEQVDTPDEQAETPVNTDLPPATEQLPSAVQPVLDITAIKTFRFSWEDVALATSYRLLENADGISGFTQVGQDIQPGVETTDLFVALYKRTNASYVIQSCNTAGCVDSNPLFVNGTLSEAIGYIKASNTGAGDMFGRSVALSADGNTLAVGAFEESSSATGVNGDQTDNLAGFSGAVYVFARSGPVWEQQAYIKASNTDAIDRFGRSVSLSADGNMLAVGATDERSSATGINGDQFDNSAFRAGAVYVFTRSGSLWEQQAYVKASNTEVDDLFGLALSLSADGNTLAVGAIREDSSATGINGDQADNSTPDAGAVYVFTRNGSLWEQQAYIKASNTDEFDGFGARVSLSEDGNTLAVRAFNEFSSATGINGDQTDNQATTAGAVYVFARSGSVWEQQAYIKASNTDELDRFGSGVTLSADGNTLAVGATGEDSSATGINGNQADNTFAEGSGAVYVFTRSGSVWEQQAYIKASNTDGGDTFGISISLSANGNTLAVGASNERSGATGINGDQNENLAPSAGGVYVFRRMGSLWEQQAYVKASNTDAGDFFGDEVSLSADGNTLAVGARNETSGATGINGDQADNSVDIAGAVYLY